MEYDHKFDNLLVGTPVTGSYTRGVRVYKGVIAQVQVEDRHKPPYYVKLYKEFPEKNLWFYPWEIQSVDSGRAGEKPHLRPDRIPPGYRMNPDNGELERIPRPPRVNDPRLEPPRVRPARIKLRNVDELFAANDAFIRGALNDNIAVNAAGNNFADQLAQVPVQNIDEPEEEDLDPEDDDEAPDDFDDEQDDDWDADHDDDVENDEDV
jgi:hypothetical protein